jgi:hypothetical protein
MANLFDSALNFADAALQGNAGVSVVYSRKLLGVWTALGTGGVITATVGKTLFELTDDQGFLTKFESRDFLIPVADLLLAAVATLPLAGDRISEVQGGTTYTYEVMGPGNEPAFRYSDDFRKLLRIHTKLIAKA